jgi:hypothetical protein
MSTSQKIIRIQGKFTKIFQFVFFQKLMEKNLQKLGQPTDT